METLKRCRGVTKLPRDFRLLKIPADMIHVIDRDLARAGIEKHNERCRVVDLHVLRHAFDVPRPGHEFTALSNPGWACHAPVKRIHEVRGC